jgi:Na+-driven multidrug efflux pump
MLLLSGFGILTAAIFNYLFVSVLHMGIEGVAAAMLATYFIYGTLFTGYAFRHYSERKTHLLGFLARVYTPFLWLLATLILLTVLLPHIGKDITSDLINTLVKLAIFAVCYIPLIYYLNLKTSIVEKVLNLVKFPSIRKR